ncbi:MAG: hypothetical protein K0U47_11515 [Epsilonproteobacteria bacterium]|nr:hypothetical protein [Campylobacterota bacterium]
MEYTQDIVALIHTLELQRASELKRFGFITLFIVLVNIFFFFKFRTNFLLTVGLGVIVLIVSFYLINNRYTNEVNHTLLPQLVKHADIDLIYDADYQVDVEILNHIKLFSHKIENRESSGAIKYQLDEKSISCAFVTLESVKIDTEEGEHFTKRFEGLLLEVDFALSFDQTYLISSQNGKLSQFEAGEYLNPSHMGLEVVSILKDDWTLYSKDAQNHLPSVLLEKLIVLKERLGREVWVVFESNRAYVLIDGITKQYNISLFHTMKGENFIDRYLLLFNAIKGLIQ